MSIWSQSKPSKFPSKFDVTTIDMFKNITSIGNGSIQKNPSYLKTRVLTYWNTELELGNFDTRKYTLCNEEITSVDLDQIDNQYMLMGTVNGSVYICDVNKLEQQNFCSISQAKSEHSEGSSIQHVQWNPVDNGLFTTSQSSREIHVWDPNTMKKVVCFSLESKITNHHLSPVAANHSLIASATKKGVISFCDLRTTAQCLQLWGHKGSCNVVKWNPINQYHITSGGDDGTIRLWDTRSGKSCYKVIKKLPDSQNGGPSDVGSIMYNQSGTKLICFRTAGHIQIFNTVSFKFVEINKTCSYRFSHASNCLTVGSSTNPEFLYVPDGRKISAYNTDSGQHIFSHKMHFSNVHGVVYNQNNNTLYSFGNDRNLFIWKPKAYQYNNIMQGCRHLYQDSWGS